MKKIVLPFPPSINDYYQPQRRGNGARLVLKKAGRVYREISVKMLRNIGQPIEGRLFVKVTLNPHMDAGEWDLDNRMKALLDALQHGGAIRDDNQIDHLEIVRGVESTPGTAIVEIGVYVE